MKIGLCGTMSVGKTTLVKALEYEVEFIDYKFTTERSKYLRDLGIPLNTDSTVKGQSIFLAERASELLNKNIITDRTIIDVMAFAKCADSINEDEANVFCDFAATMLSEYDHIFYVTTEGTIIEDNGVRTVDEEYREKIDHTIRELLFEYRDKIRDFTTISGTTEQRLKQINEVLFP
jgi:nicotinamide riboside kinase